MSKETLVIGSGTAGLRWAAYQIDGPTLCLDSDPDLPDSPYLIHGDILSLDPKIGLVKKIYADFLLNKVFPCGLTYEDVIDNPTILQKPSFPSLIRDWYREKFLPSGESINNYLKDISLLLRIVALQQMWGILAEGGEIIIVDTRKTVQWITENVTEILSIDPKDIYIENALITSGDKERSDSGRLRRLRKFPNAAKKVILKKMRGQIQPLA